MKDNKEENQKYNYKKFEELVVEVVNCNWLEFLLEFQSILSTTIQFSMVRLVGIESNIV